MQTIQVLNYSPKAIAVIGDTRELKEKLKAVGGKWNPRLKCGAGWVFSVKRKEQVEAIIKGEQLNPGAQEKPQANHWLYALALEGKVNVKALNKLIRQEAKKLDVNCNVRKEHGNILVVINEEGPNNEQLKTFANNLQGKGFDGSIDMEYYYYHCVTKAGEVLNLGTRGTHTSCGYTPDTLQEAPKGAVKINTYSYVTITNPSGTLI